MANAREDTEMHFSNPTLRPDMLYCPVLRTEVKASPRHWLMQAWVCFNIKTKFTFCLSNSLAIPAQCMTDPLNRLTRKL